MNKHKTVVKIKLNNQKRINKQISDNVNDIKQSNLGRIDVTKTTNVVNAVSQGSVRHVQELNIEDKCLDLKKALAQQSTPRFSTIR